MALIYSNSELFVRIKSFITSASSFVIFAPYIKRKVLSKLLGDVEGGEKNAIITSWKPQDIALGVSDVEIYPLCKEKQIPLLINNRIHLKSYTINDFQECVVTSSNISSRGLALHENFNFELGAIITNLSVEDKIYFDSIIQDSNSVTDIIYNQVKAQIAKLEINEEILPNFEIINDPSNKYFLLTSLPMSDDIEKLYNVYKGNNNYDEKTLRSASHDIRLYKIPPGCAMPEFRIILKTNFFEHQFIKLFLEFIDEGKYFGEITAWLHNVCKTVPTPRRFEIKEALQRIYHFIVDLSDGQYTIEVPKTHSTYLKKTK